MPSDQPIRQLYQQMANHNEYQKGSSSNSHQSSSSSRSSATPATLLGKKHKWSLNFNTRSKNDRTDLPSPPGYIPAATAQFHAEGSRETDPSLVAKRSWDIALGPMKQLPMNLFIMYMAGNSISIFPIMMVGMLFLRPIKALLTISSTFKTIEGNQAILQKIVYFLGNTAGIALALYKCQSMGLLPTHPSDWLDFLEPPVRVEFSGGGLSM